MTSTTARRHEVMTVDVVSRLVMEGVYEAS